MTTPRAAGAEEALSARCTPERTALRRPGDDSTLPTDDRNAGKTLRITELRICQIPERVVVFSMSTQRCSTVMRSLNGARCSLSAPGALRGRLEHARDRT